jgi:hypothetical protein
MILGHLRGLLAWGNRCLPVDSFGCCSCRLRDGRPGQTDGTVTDADTKKPIAGASISFKNLKIGTTTDESGHYEIVLPLGEHIVIFSALGTGPTWKSCA